MPTFHFYHPIQVRYGDLDPQGHVNNAKYLTYIEQGRILYLEHLNLWKGGDFLDLGLIMADVYMTFRKSIQYGDPVQVGVRIARLGNKSMSSEYVLVDARDSSEFATGTSVLVAYDYRNSHSVPIPENWRKAIMQFEGLTDDRQ
jgi:acyl-CoA thioester hydrolase